jgi:hypothetical protein
MWESIRAVDEIERTFPSSKSTTTTEIIVRLPTAPFSPLLMSAPSRRPFVKPPAVSVSATPSIAEKFIKSRLDASSELDEPNQKHRVSATSYRLNSGLGSRPSTSKKEHALSALHTSSKPDTSSQDAGPANDDGALADELDFVTVESMGSVSSRDKASRILGIKHRKSMEPIPASARTSMVSSRSYRDPPPSPSFVPTLPLTSLYLVSGLPKSPHTWTLADPDSVAGLHHSEGAVNRWWRPEVLGSTVSPGAGGKRKKKGKSEGELMKGAGALGKQEVGKMLSKALKVPSPHFLNAVSNSCDSSLSPGRWRLSHPLSNPRPPSIPLRSPSQLPTPLSHPPPRAISSGRPFSPTQTTAPPQPLLPTHTVMTPSKRVPHPGSSDRRASSAIPSPAGTLDPPIQATPKGARVITLSRIMVCVSLSGRMPMRSAAMPSVERSRPAAQGRNLLSRPLRRVSRISAPMSLVPIPEHKPGGPLKRALEVHGLRMAKRTLILKAMA